MRTFDTLIEEARAVRADREKLYGETTRRNLEAIGLVWSGMLRQHLNMDIPPLPAHMVSLMHTVVKNLRAVTHNAKHHDDNYTDALNYTRFAHESSSGLGPPKKEEVDESGYTPASDPS